MPFDVLPRHQITLPPVQFFHPSAEYARLAFEGAKLKYDAVTKGIDSILNAADPANIAQRRLAMANARYEMQYGIQSKIDQAEFEREYGMPQKIREAQFQRDYGVPLQEEQAKMMTKWYQDHPGVPYPKTIQDVNAYHRAEQDRQSGDRYNGAAAAVAAANRVRQGQTTPPENIVPGISAAGAGAAPVTFAPGTVTNLGPSATPAPPVAASSPAPVAPAPSPSATPDPSATPAAAADTSDSIYGPIYDANGNLLPPNLQGVGTGT